MKIALFSCRKSWSQLAMMTEKSAPPTVMHTRANCRTNVRVVGRGETCGIFLTSDMERKVFGSLVIG